MAKAADPAPSVVLLYHRMGSPLVRSRMRGQYVLPAFFRWQLSTLMRRGYQPAALAEMFAQGGASAGRFCVTFDDGYESVGRLARPILAEMRIPGTVFVVAGAVGKTAFWDQPRGGRGEKMLTEAQMREMASGGIEIGSHSMSHPRLTEVSDAVLREEVGGSKKALEDALGRLVAGFSYPYGAWDERVREAVVEAGYKYAAAAALGVMGAGVDRFAIARVNVRWSTVGWRLLAKIRRACREQRRQQ